MSAPLSPMLLSSAPAIPKGEDWAFEPKWDGFRCLAHLGDRTRLLSRRGTDLTPYAGELSGLHRQVPVPVVLDAELVQVRSGEAGLHALRRPVLGRTPEATAVLVVFDLLAIGGCSPPWPTSVAA